MRAVVQRANAASVAVNGQVVAQIQRGICVLLGIFTGDAKEDADFMVRKLLHLRLFEDPSNPAKGWSKNVMEIGGDVLVVSQFTLCHVLKGNKPDFHNAMPGGQSKPFFDAIIADMRKAYKADKIHVGVFGAMMNVQCENNGPVTIVVDSVDRGIPANSAPKPAAAAADAPSDETQ